MCLKTDYNCLASDNLASKEINFKKLISVANFPLLLDQNGVMCYNHIVKTIKRSNHNGIYSDF